MVLDKKQKVILLIDEASLLRLEGFAELHTLTQFEGDSKPIPHDLGWLNNPLDKLCRGTLSSGPLVWLAGSHLKGVNRQRMEDYLNHPLRIAGLDHCVFSEQTVTAIHQGP